MGIKITRIAETPIGWHQTEDEPAWTLAQLLRHWGSAYVIAGRGERWIARRRDGKGELHADSPDLLHEMIVADYGRHPVPRDPSQ